VPGIFSDETFCHGSFCDVSLCRCTYLLKITLLDCDRPRPKLFVKDVAPCLLMAGRGRSFLAKMWLGGTVAGSSTKTDLVSLHDILFSDLYQEVSSFPASTWRLVAFRPLPGD